MRDLPFHSPPRLLLFNIIPLRALAQLGHGSIRPNKESVISSGETIREPEGYIYTSFMWMQHSTYYFVILRRGNYRQRFPPSRWLDCRSPYPEHYL